MRTRFIEYDQESYIHEEEVIGLHVNMKNDETNSNGRRERQELVAMIILHREFQSYNVNNEMIMKTHEEIL
jgi:hypothetical protein